MLIAAMLLASTPVTTTIYVDHRRQCDVSRIAYDAQARSMKIATRLQAKLKAQGKTVKIVRLLPGMVLDRRTEALIINPAC